MQTRGIPLTCVWYQYLAFRSCDFMYIRQEATTFISYLGRCICLEQDFSVYHNRSDFLIYDESSLDNLNLPKIGWLGSVLYGPTALYRTQSFAVVLASQGPMSRFKCTPLKINSPVNLQQPVVLQSDSPSNCIMTPQSFCNIWFALQNDSPFWNGSQ